MSFPDKIDRKDKEVFLLAKDLRDELELTAHTEAVWVRCCL